MQITPAKNSIKNVDLVLLFAVLTLVGIGLCFVYSASFYSANEDFGNKFYFLIKQAVGAAVGLVGMFVASVLDVKTLKKAAVPLLIVSYILLVLVFVPHIGIENYGAKRWIGFGFLSIQPSEIAKFAFVLFCAAYISREQTNMARFVHCLPVIGVGMSFCALIILEPNMSITICMGLIMVAMLFVGGMRYKHFILILAPLLVAVPLLIFLEPYRVQRLLAFVNPWASPKGEGYQLIQSLYALGSGGWFGVGYLNSRQKFDFLPFAESDFVFSIVGEELGLVGATFVLALFAVVIYRGIRLSLNSPTKFYSLLAFGVTAIIAIQSLLNIAVVTGSIPPTGLPLPFISYGGTSLAVFCTGIGLLLNVSRSTTQKIA